MEPGRRGLRRERRKHGWQEVAASMVVGFEVVGWAMAAHETRNMFAE